MHRQLLAAVIAVYICAPAADAQKAAPGRKCTTAEIDTVQYGSAVYRDCEVEKPAKLKHEERPVYRLAAGVQCARVEMLFVVDTTGSVVTNSATLVSTTEPEYAILVLASLSKWRYEPARREKAAVSQLVLARHSLEGNKMVKFSVGPRRADDVPMPASGLSTPCK
jgi:hypothetical protein